MLGINGKQWNDIQWTDVEEFLNEIEAVSYTHLTLPTN